MSTTFLFEVHTPFHRFFSGPVEAIILTLSDGEICVYANHEAFTAPVKTGFLRIKNDRGDWRTAFVADGILEVKEHKSVLMSDAAEWPEDIDTERAQKAMENAEEILKTSKLKFETDKAASALNKAKFRLKTRELTGREKG